MNKLFIMITVFAVILGFSACEQPANKEDAAIVSPSVTLKITNQSSCDLFDITYAAAEFGDLSIGKEYTQAVNANSLPIYFYLKIGITNIYCKTNDIITCETGKATEQPITNNTLITAIDSGLIGTMSKVYEALKKPVIIVTQEEIAIDQSADFSFGDVPLGSIKDIVFTIKNSGETDLVIESVNGAGINLTDNDSGCFSVFTQPFDGAAIPPKGSTTFVLRFNSPAAPETLLNATVTIKTNSQINADFSFRALANAVRVEYAIGDTGPGGGIIFYVEDGQYKECGAELGGYSWDNAMTAARNYQGGGFTDWQLPNEDELGLMYNNLHQNGLGNFKNASYWSSSRVTATVMPKPIISHWRPSVTLPLRPQGPITIYTNSAKNQYFGDGSKGSADKEVRLLVRAVRAF